MPFFSAGRALDIHPSAISPVELHEEIMSAQLPMPMDT